MFTLHDKLDKDLGFDWILTPDDQGIKGKT